MRRPGAQGLQNHSANFCRGLDRARVAGGFSFSAFHNEKNIPIILAIRQACSARLRLKVTHESGQLFQLLSVEQQLLGPLAQLCLQLHNALPHFGGACRCSLLVEGAHIASFRLTQHQTRSWCVLVSFGTARTNATIKHAGSSSHASHTGWGINVLISGSIGPEMQLVPKVHGALWLD